MKAVAYREYGGPDRLELVERSKPEPRPGELLVRVMASSVNAADYRLMRADPFVIRFDNGIFRPTKHTVLGGDFAGFIEAIGEGVVGFQVGDEVFGDVSNCGMGAFAEYVCPPEHVVAHKPDGVSFEAAASAAMGGITALQALRDLAELKACDDVLIQGAGGGVGGYLVQVASSFGARVTAVCGKANANLARENGATTVLDYREVDFAQRPEKYDVIVGVNGYRPLRVYRRCLREGGRYVMVGGTSRQIFGALLWGNLVFAGSGKSCRVLTLDAGQKGRDIRLVAEMLADGRLRPRIECVFDLSDTAAAIERVERGHVRGKVAIRVPLRRVTGSDFASSTVTTAQA